MQIHKFHDILTATSHHSFAPHHPFTQLEGSSGESAPGGETSDQKVFDHFDADGNGKITEAEFKDAVNGKYSNIFDTQRDAYIEAIDAHVGSIFSKAAGEDGLVTFKEFEAATNQSDGD